MIASDRGRPPDGERAPRAPRVRAHLQVERAGGTVVPARRLDDHARAVRSATTERRCSRRSSTSGPGVFHRAHQAVYSDAVLRTGSPTVRSRRSPCDQRRSGTRSRRTTSSTTSSSARPDGQRRSAEVVRPVGALLGVDVAADDIAGRPRSTDRPVGHRRDDHRHRARLLHRRARRSARPRAAPRSCTTCTPAAPRGRCPASCSRRSSAGAPPAPPRSPSRPATTCRRTARPPLAWCASSPSATTRRSRRGSTATSPSLRRWSTGWCPRRPPRTGTSCAARASTTPGRSSPSRSRNGCWRTCSRPGVRPGSEPVSSWSATSPSTSRPSCASSTPRTPRSPTGVCSRGHRSVADAVADPVLFDATRDLLASEVLPTLDRSARLGPCRPTRSRCLIRFANRALAYTTAKVAGDGSQKLPVRLLPTVRARLAAGASARRCARGARGVGDVHGRPSLRRLRRRGRRRRPVGPVASARWRWLPRGGDGRAAWPAGVPRCSPARRARLPHRGRSSRPGFSGAAMCDAVLSVPG